MRDTVNVLRRGTPAVGHVHEPFERLARAQAAQLGMPRLALLIYPQDLPGTDGGVVVEARARDVAARAAALLRETGG